jgi:hypothetical protein
VSLFDVVTVRCPYCFEVVEVDFDPETEGELIQDCEVCCNPWRVRVARDEDGGALVDVERAQD